MSNDECCKNCRYYLRLNNENYSLCRRYPPAQTNSSARIRSVLSEYPSIVALDWCGEFKEKENKNGDS